MAILHFSKVSAVRILAQCGLAAIFLFSVTAAIAQNQQQNQGTVDDKFNTEGDNNVEYDDSEHINADSQQCPRRNAFGRAACSRICNYNDQKEFVSDSSVETIWTKPTTCRESYIYDHTYCSCPNDPDGGLDLSSCRRIKDGAEEGGSGGEEISALATAEEDEHCQVMCGLEKKVAYACNVKVEEELVGMCGCGGQVNATLVEAQQKKKRWVELVRQKRAGKAPPAGSDNKKPTKYDLNRYLNALIAAAKVVQTKLEALQNALQFLLDDLNNKGTKLESKKTTVTTKKPKKGSK